MELIKESAKGKVYQADGFKIFYRNKGAVSGDNAENKQERVCLLVGCARITEESKIFTVDAPAEFKFPEKTYHKIDAMTDIVFLVFEE